MHIYIYIYTRPHSKMAVLGCAYTLGKQTLHPRMLYRSECHQRSFLRGLDASARLNVRLGSVGVLCQLLEV